jgi:hypothetical protein
VSAGAAATGADSAADGAGRMVSAGAQEAATITKTSPTVQNKRRDFIIILLFMVKGYLSFRFSYIQLIQFLSRRKLYRKKVALL